MVVSWLEQRSARMHSTLIIKSLADRKSSRRILLAHGDQMNPQGRQVRGELDRDVAERRLDHVDELACEVRSAAADLGARGRARRTKCEAEARE